LNSAYSALMVPHASLRSTYAPDFSNASAQTSRGDVHIHAQDVKLLPIHAQAPHQNKVLLWVGWPGMNEVESKTRRIFCSQAELR